MSARRLQVGSTEQYTLRIPSYADGRICCEGTGCSKLNKDYVSCSTLQAGSDYIVNTNCTASAVEEGTNPTACENGATQGSQVCNTCGTQTTQVCVNGAWENQLGPCTVSNASECPCSETKPDYSDTCTTSGGGTGTKQFTWNNSTCQYDEGECVCGSPTNHGWSSYYGDWCPQVGTGVQKQIGTGSESFPYRYYYTWNNSTCAYDETGCTEIPELPTTPTASGVWQSEVVHRYDVVHGYCYSSSYTFYAGKSPLVDMDKRYAQIEADLKDMYPECAFGVHDGAKAEGVAIGTSCSRGGISKTGKACPTHLSPSIPRCVNGFFENNIQGGFYTGSDSPGCMQTGSDECPEQFAPTTFCIMPYHFYLYTVR